MTTAAKSGFGTTLKWNAVALAEGIKITGPSQLMEAIDVSNHDSPSGFREFIAGFADGGEISIEGNFKTSDSTGQIAMHTDFQAKTTRAWIITFPSSLGTMAGNGYVTKFELDFPDDKQITFSATIKVTGKPTLTIT